MFAGILCRRQASCLVRYNPKNSNGLSTRHSRPGMPDLFTRGIWSMESSSTPRLTIHTYEEKRSERI